MANIDILDSVKLNLRITHDKLNYDLLEMIEAARAEMIRAGVNPALAMDDSEPLIRDIIKTFCRMNFTTDVQRYDRQKEAWFYQLDCIRKSSKYRAVDSDV